MPLYIEGCPTILDYFERSVKNFPNQDFLGTRTQLANDDKGQPQFGEYTWKTFKEIEVQAK
jgi:hypothetical protein